MKILHVLHHSAPHLTGYAIRSHSLLRHQRRLGLQIAAVTSTRHGASARTRDEIDSIAYYRTSVSGGMLARIQARLPLLPEASVITSLRARVERLAESFEPDIIHAHSPATCGLAGLWAARRLGLPLVYEVRDFWENASVDLGKWKAGSPRYRLARAMEQAVLERARAVVTICEAQRRAVIDRGIPAARVTVVPNGVDAEELSLHGRSEDLARELGLDGSFVLAYIGAMLPYEGLPVLIAAHSRLRRAALDARLMLVGGGEAAEAIQAAARESDAKGAVVWVGPVARDRLLDYYALADLVVYPRLRTATTLVTTPLKPLEAMALGKAVVASDLPAMREIIRHEETGLLVAPSDADALAAACERLIREPERRLQLARAGREWVHRARRWADLVALYLDVYRDAQSATCLAD